MLALGFNGTTKLEWDECQDGGFNGHDSAAVLVTENAILAAVEEERLSRIKHTNFFPRRAIRWTLEQAGIRISDVDLIAVPVSELEADLHAKRAPFFDRPGSPRFSSGRERAAATLLEEFGVDLSNRIRYCHHHLAHAWSTFFPSGFEEALVITLDGAGGDGKGGSSCGIVARGTVEGGIELIKTFPARISLGNWYTLLSSVLGYGRFDEYKVMGLAPYGDPSVYRPLFAKFYTLGENGDYQFTEIPKIVDSLREAGLTSSARKRGEPFTQQHKDYAAALQEWLEVIATHVVRHFQRSTGLRKLCLAGGVAHNCTMNGRFLYSGLFDEIFVQPASHDAGGSYGAAVAALFQEGAKLQTTRLAHLSLGPGIPEGLSLERALARWSDFVSFERVENIEKRTAQSLAEGSVVGWVQGRAEFGPRALGNRSILADPRPAENKSRINSMVKQRESYRPFAPSVLEEHLHDLFDVPKGVADLSHMIFVVKVRAEYREQLGAITHVDGTARVQTVSKVASPRYWQLIEEFNKITGMPVLLNTSFNNNVEPIITTVEDALTCFLTTEIDLLVVGDYFVKKRSGTLSSRACLKLVPVLPPARRLVKGKTLVKGEELTRFCIESTTTDYFHRKRIDVSAPLFSCLLAESDRDLATRTAELGLDWRTIKEVADEVMELWNQRVVLLKPPSQRPAG
jgi:carbamoyltransferase